LGHCYEPSGPEKDLTFRKLLSKGYDSVWARAAPDGPMNYYDEWIVYNKAQVRLLSVKVDGKDLLSKRAKRGGMLSISERGQSRH